MKTKKWLAHQLLAFAATAGLAIEAFAQDSASSVCDCKAICDSENLCCDEGCDSLFGDACRDGLFTSFLRQSDHCFDDFISPMINFVYFEDPRNVTELRPIFVNHWVPNQIGGGIPAGGSIQLYAAQFRIALTERLSLIAVKDGFIVDDTNGALDTLLDDGWADVVVLELHDVDGGDGCADGSDVTIGEHANIVDAVRIERRHRTARGRPEPDHDRGQPAAVVAR